ncbi:MAG TPA: hypothetical protein VGR49_03380 [Actinomycetota bacterium]|jgi:hypothetical protein|nr:hypothetical protein [Actinomycetota bacterium]
MVAGLLAAAYVVLLVGGGIGLVAALAGSVTSAPLVAAAVGALWMCAVVTAGLATHAFLRRRWWWGLALLAAWPVSVPAYVWLLRRESEPGSGEPDVT